MTDITDDRWSIRGVAKPVRRWAGDLARREGMALGPWLTRLIERAAADGPAPDPVGERLAMLETAVAVLSQRLTALEIDQEMGVSRFGGEGDGAATRAITASDRQSFSL